MIKLVNVVKRFGGTPVLNGVDLSIYRDKTTTIVGKSGGGKSVLLKHIVGLLEQDSGEILYEGVPINKLKKKDKIQFKKTFSYMFQGNALFDSMTVFKNIALPLRENARLSQKEIERKVKERMDQLDISGIEDKYPSQISGGMMKRVALARALITDPKIVLFDEPTTGLDPIRKSAVHTLITEYQKRLGFTAVMVSHEIPDIFYISHRIAMLEEGKILFEGDPEAFQRSDNPVIRKFVRGLESGQDDLTGTAHYSHAENRFKEAIARFNRYEIPFSVILFKIENISEVNTHLGHRATHNALKDLADRIQATIRVTDTCSRYKMDHILVILSDTNREQAEKVCSKVIEEFEVNVRVDIKPYADFCYSIVAGISEFKKGNSLEEVIGEAESSKSVVYRFNVC
ncbi:MAG: ATP-binding cassette domain-containing protein [Desulfobacterales bacterium]